MPTDLNRQGRVVYDYDDNATNPDNYIKEEEYTVSNTRYRDSNIIVPEFAPFFAKDVKVMYKKNANSNKVELKPGEYELAFNYKGATRVVGQPVYGAILLNNLDIDGLIYIDYRTIGGEQIQDNRVILQKFIEKAVNPREILWDAVTDSPKLFPPHKHPVNWEELMKLDDLINALDRINKTNIKGYEDLNTSIQDFLKQIDIPKYNEMVEKLDNHTYNSLLKEVASLKSDLEEYKVRLIALENK